MRSAPAEQEAEPVPDAGQTRRLAAILSADVVGYSRLLGANEAATLTSLKAAVDDVLTPLVRSHKGRIVKTMGDGVLIEFASAVEALLCAVEFQRSMAAQTPGATKLDFRIGIDDGDVLRRRGDVFGDVVNLAARLQAMAAPGGICVSARVRDDVLGRVDIVFEDAGEHRLKNIARPVRVFRVRLDDAAGERRSLPMPDKPSIAVLPFDNMSGDPAQDYVADCITEDIISALSRWRWFFVIARNSSFIYKGRAVDVAQVGRDLGVRYVLEGSVRKTGARFRVIAQLIDATSATHIWTDTFDRDILDVFELLDDITEHVVGQIEPAMLQSESARVARKSPRDLSAFDCFQRGMAHLNQVSKEGCIAAEALFREAIARDPEFSLAHAGLSRILYGLVAYGWTDDAARDLKGAEAAARSAIALDPRDAWAYFALSGALLYLGRHEEALDEAKRTVALNPNFAFGHFRVGQVLIYSGRAAEAIGSIERSIRHNPYDPQIGAMRTMLALANYHAGAYEAAIACVKEADRLGDPRAAAILGASLARLGRIEEARAAFSAEAQARAAAAGRRLIPYARASDLQDLLEGLRLAGLGAPLAVRLEADALPPRPD